MRVYAWTLQACGVALLGWFVYVISSKIWGWSYNNASGFAAVIACVLVVLAIAEEVSHL